MQVLITRNVLPEKQCRVLYLVLSKSQSENYEEEQQENEKQRKMKERGKKREWKKVEHDCNDNDGL